MGKGWRGDLGDSLERGIHDILYLAGLGCGRTWNEWTTYYYYSAFTYLFFYVLFYGLIENGIHALIN